MRGRDGRVQENFDIRQPVSIEMAWEVLQPGQVPIPNMQLHNDQGICLFATSDTDPQWARTTKPAGAYRSRVTIPGNFLNEGMVVVDAAITSLEPLRLHAYERQVVSFQVVDTLEGSPLRGDYAGTIPGAVRPWLEWRTAQESVEQPTPGGIA